jgi:chaperonin cofactor prefoldin
MQAYGKFTQAVQRLQSALKVSNPTRRNSEIDAVRGMLYQALADYTNPQLITDLNAAGQLRRAECGWLIFQVIILTYQLQNEMNAVSDRLQNLQNQISQDLRMIIDCCNSLEELDFLFPEITRLQNHDVVILRTWQAHVDWMQELSPSEIKELENLETDRIENLQIDVSTKPEEILNYENFKEKSHYLALRDQLRFTINPESRREPEVYISQMATNIGQKALAPSNWSEVPDFTVANLYWYFKQQETVIA